MIQLQAIQLQRGAKVLLDGADLRVHPGHKLGLIGANGSGKSSLFKLLLGEIHEDAGQLDIPAQWRLAHMAQEVGEVERTALDYVLDGDEELRQLQAQLEHSDGEKLAKLYEQLEAIGAYDADARAQRLLRGLGFAADEVNKAVQSFSGGWRIRLNLAKALMCRSDLLLLDEPTNHLDLDACVWLEQWLQSYPGTLLIISHDRDFLDNVVDGIVHLEQQTLHSYSGNYSDFEMQRAERLAQQAQAYEKQQVRIKEIENFVRRFKAKASKAKQAQSRVKELERMQKIDAAHVDSPFSFRFSNPEKIPQTLISLSDVELGYGDTSLLRSVNFSVLGSSRVGLLGHNGAGKSTLLKYLAGVNKALGGQRSDAQFLSIGYYSQHQLETLDFAASPALHISRIDDKATEQQIRSFLGSFGFHGDRAFETIEHFSGGEKARLALALIAWQKPNLLLLDEPTNHLDLEVRHALTLALQAYEGAVVLVSHDRHLLKNTVDQFVLVDSGKVELFAGDLDDYAQWLKQQSPGEDKEIPVQESKNAKKEKRQQAAALRQKLKPLSNKIKKIEAQVEKLGEALATVEARLADADIYDEKNKEELKQLLLKQAELKSDLDISEATWFELNEELEQAQAD
ncbi:ATP-binding cassette domain-containing protein [Agaribacterium haliotis]|uniref:ATP-binding cassette domain-containing protein n=1 Tax=Agaribacterium haliotis TaxID=2013869 RepID=UPI000BB5471D|nr:ATP-binding cassette domain-containing protein [Agaribacterium haliotis]